ncbi:MAG TPA: histidine kinase [Sphingomonas sp.]|nr:histidine kinase [Sphingomonas sp.]
MHDLVPGLFRRREAVTAVVLTILLWLVALLLWSARDIASGEPFPFAYKLLLVQTFALGLVFSAALAGVIGLAWRLPRRWMIPLIVAAALAIAVLHGLIDAYLLQQLARALQRRPAPLAELFNSGLMPFVLIYGLYATALGLMQSEMAVRERERQLAEARDAAQQAQLAALRFQLNPHFLFNTLNAISSLIVTGRNADAERVTVKLSDFLRLTLEADPEAEVTLDEELATTQSYLDIESARFADRLQLSFDCPPALLNAYVPSFLLQPLVENSIKYAVSTSRGPVALEVRARATGGVLEIVVEDSGGGAARAPAASGTGVGLDNVRKRLAAFHGAAGRMEARATPQGYVVKLTLPLRFAPMREAAE